MKWGGLVVVVVATFYAAVVTSLSPFHRHTQRRFESSFRREATTKQTTRDFSHRPSHQRRDHVYNLELLDECWNQTSWTMPYGGFMKTIAGGLISPVPQSFFAMQRALDMNVSQAATACHYLLKRGRTLLVRTSAMEQQKNATAKYLDPSSDWTIIQQDVDETAYPDGWIKVLPAIVPTVGAMTEDTVAFDPTITTHQIAVMILDEAIAVANHTRSSETLADRQNALVRALKCRLFWTIGTELRGRTAADTALTLALAGIVDDELYEMIYHIVYLELERRKRRSLKDVLHTIEKAAASGAPASHAMFQTARECLAGQKGIQPDIMDRIQGEMSLLKDDRPPLWLWRFASRFPRPSDAPHATSRDELKTSFAQPERPVVVDLGCGFGLTLLGLACKDQKAGVESDNVPSYDVVTEDCNLLGCDANPLNVNYGRGIARRWNVEDRLQYVCSSASELLAELIGANVRVHSVLMQFPTPYRLQQDEGNQQLPPSSDVSFMASRTAIRQVAQLHAGALLLIQSNCEDVALQMFQWAVDEGMESIPAKQFVQSPSACSTERTQRWLQLHGNPCRAVGPFWSAVPLLPGARSETEVTCTIQGIPIYRCLFRVS